MLYECYCHCCYKKNDICQRCERHTRRKFTFVGIVLCMAECREIECKCRLVCDCVYKNCFICCCYFFTRWSKSKPWYYQIWEKMTSTVLIPFNQLTFHAIDKINWYFNQIIYATAIHIQNIWRGFDCVSKYHFHFTFCTNHDVQRNRSSVRSEP